MPVGEEGFGADHEGRAVRPLAAQGGEQAEALQGFAETHFIGQNATVAVGRVIEQPLDPGFLVVAQDGQEVWRDAGIERPDRRGGGFSEGSAEGVFQIAQLGAFDAESAAGLLRRNIAEDFVEIHGISQGNHGNAAVGQFFVAGAGGEEPGERD